MLAFNRSEVPEHKVDSSEGEFENPAAAEAEIVSLW
jgi:hypothetical protein